MPSRPIRCIGLVLASLLAGGARHAAAQPAASEPRVPNDPYKYDLRIGAFPLAFQAGISQSHFGSAARAEFDIARHVALALGGQVPWLNVAGETHPHTWSLRAGFVFNLVDEEELEPLSGTIYPEDTPAVGGPGPGTDHDFDMPVSQRLGGPRMELPNDEREGTAPMRSVHSIRVGYDLARAVERGRPDNADASVRYFVNTMHALYAGYGWGSHWNLNATAGGGERRVGWRRFYVDAMLTLPALDDAKRVGMVTPPGQPDFFPLGVRLGMEGSIAALLHDAPGVGFGYSLELGALPGKSGFEGYLLVGLGIELDFATRERSLR